MSATLSAFDTLRYVKRLKEADVPEKQAEAQAEALHEVLAGQTVVHAEISTRAVADLDTKTEKATTALEKKVDVGFAEMRGEMKLQRALLGAVLGGIVTLIVRSFF